MRDPAAAAALVAPAAAAGRPLDLPDATLATRPAGPPGDGATRPDQPAAQRPTTARPPSVSIQRRPPTRRLEPGDLVCPECGEGNPTTRKFCSRCGTSLETAQMVKAKWWRKFLPGRGPKKRQAGDRPSARKTRKSFPTKVMGVLFSGASRVVGIILIVGALVYGIIPNVRSSVNDEVGTVKDKFNSWIHPTRTEVIPTGVFASTQGKRHPAQFLIDGPTNTFWAGRVPRARTRKITFDFTFQNKFDLRNLAIWNGVGSSKSPDYTSTRRLQTIFLEFPGTSIKGCEVPVTDLPNKAVKIDVSKCNADSITRIRVTLLTYAGDSKLRVVTVAKMQFYKKG